MKLPTYESVRPQLDLSGSETLLSVRTYEDCDLASKVDVALISTARKGNIDSSEGIFTIEGMSGKKYRLFINRLIRSLSNARYLEVGSWAGSTLCSAIHRNKVWAVAVDDWSQFGGPKDEFMKNVREFRTKDAEVIFIESDFRKLDYTQMQQGFNVYLFDGPHEARDQYDGLAMALPCLDKQFVFIVDDWNWIRVREGTLDAIEKCGLKKLYVAEIRTNLNELQPTQNLGKHSNWHNGYFISVLEKP